MTREDFDVCKSGTLKVLDEKDLQIQALQQVIANVPVPGSNMTTDEALLFLNDYMEWYEELDDDIRLNLHSIENRELKEALRYIVNMESRLLAHAQEVAQNVLAKYA